MYKYLWITILVSYYSVVMTQLQALAGRCRRLQHPTRFDDLRLRFDGNRTSEGAQWRLAMEAALSGAFSA